MKSGNSYMISVALIVAIGGFLLGFDATVISGTVPFIKKYFDLSGTSGDLKLGWAVSCLGWGALGGNAVAGLLSDRFGRKKILMCTAVLFAVSALLSATATTFAFLLFRGFWPGWRWVGPFSSLRFILRKSPHRSRAAVWFRSISS